MRFKKNNFFFFIYGWINVVCWCCLFSCELFVYLFYYLFIFMPSFLCFVVGISCCWCMRIKTTLGGWRHWRVAIKKKKINKKNKKKIIIIKKKKKNIYIYIYIYIYHKLPLPPPPPPSGSYEHVVMCLFSPLVLFYCFLFIGFYHDYNIWKSRFY